MSWSTKGHCSYKTVTGMQRSETVAIRTKIQPSYSIGMITKTLMDFDLKRSRRVSGRASASGSGGRVGSNPGLAIPKALNMVPVAYLLSA